MWNVNEFKLEGVCCLFCGLYLCHCLVFTLIVNSVFSYGELRSTSSSSTVECFATIFSLNDKIKGRCRCFFIIGVIMFSASLIKRG